MLGAGALAVAALIVAEFSGGGRSWLQLALLFLLGALVGTELYFGYRDRPSAGVASEESRYRFVAEQAPVIAYLAEPGEKARWHYVSPHIETMLGFTPEEWRDDPGLWRRQVHPDDLPLAISDERRALSSGEANATDYRMRTKDGEEIWVRDVAVGLTRDGHEITQGVIYDITGLKRAEEGLRTRERMLQGVVRERTRELERSRVETLHRLAIAAELHEEGTREHTIRVGRTSAAIALELGLSPGFVELIAEAAPLHDIGKLGISNETLLRPNALSETEEETMRRHTAVGARILGGSETPSLRLAEQIALTHHERWDGQGYPEGLSGEEIPIGGRITSVADAFDGLMYGRAYREPRVVDEALGEIKAESGARFDPAVVGAFLRLDHIELLAPIRDWAAWRTGAPPRS
jgi:PAS domain S-box-containing protein/putative nucleotidyltransferase with HDIG domain